MNSFFFGSAEEKTKTKMDHNQNKLYVCSLLPMRSVLNKKHINHIVEKKEIKSNLSLPISLTDRNYRTGCQRRNSFFYNTIN